MSFVSGTKKIKRRFIDLFKPSSSQSASIRGTYEEQNETNATSRPMHQLNTLNNATNSSLLDSSNAPTIRVDADASSSAIVETRLDTGLQSVGSAPARSDIKSGLDIAGRFAQTLLKKLPDCVDSNPVKMALSIVKAVILIKDEIGDNKDALTESLQRTRVLLEDVVGQVESGHSEHIREEIETYKQKIGEQYTQLSQITKELESRLRHLDYESYKKRIGTICNTIHETTNAFMLRMQLEIVKKADEIKKQTEMMQEQMKEDQKERRMMSLQGLNPSRKADHRTVLEGQSLKRESCAEGTRVKIIEDITIWANDCAEDSPHAFWLTGQAGSGKTTIAYTIAKQFEKVEDQSAVLGSNFLCSRQFEETRSLSRIIPTLAYQLAGKCPSYQAALHDHVEDMAAVVNHDISEQMEKLLVKPWNARKFPEDENAVTYLIVIDALDEVNEDGGSRLLELLLTTIDRHHLHNLKFLVTSRTDPQIVQLCDTFKSKTVCRLQDVPIEDAEADIEKYLDIKLPKLVGCPELVEVRKRASGLFIYAATVVRILTTSRSVTHKEQMRWLTDLLSKPSGLSGVGKGTSPIDGLYEQILFSAMSGFVDEKYVVPRLHILRTYLFSAERISPSVAATLMDDDEELARSVLDDFHAVLYVQEDRVFWYHSSFPDFITGLNHSNFHLGHYQFNFQSDQADHHYLLASSCFRIMASKTSGLKFNMGGITSSYLLDSECADEISMNMTKNVSTALRYACLYWGHHLSSSTSLTADIEPMGIHISKFLQIHVLFWIEAMNILKANSRCVLNLYHAWRWLLNVKAPLATHRILAHNLQEIANFATYFISSPAAESTPHLYISSLATWKSESTLFKNWRNRFASIPAFSPGSTVYDTPLLSVGFRARVFSVAFTHDGTQIAAGLGDNTVQIVDASTGKVMKTLVGHTGWVESVTFSNDDKWIASGSDDCMVLLWDTITGVCLKVLRGHTKLVTSVSISTNDMLIASGSADMSVRVWDVSTGNVVKIFMGHNDIVKSVSFSIDNTRIASGSRDCSVRIWDVSSDQQLTAMDGHTEGVNSVTFTIDGACVVSASWDRSIRIWDAANGVQLAVLWGHSTSVTSIAVCEPAYILSGSNAGSVRIWDMISGRTLKVLKGHAGYVYSVGCSKGPTRLVSGSGDGYLRVWNISDMLAKSNSVEAENDIITSPVTSITFSIDGTQAIFGSEDGSVHVWDLSPYRELRILKGNNKTVTAVAISQTGSRFGWATKEEVWVWDALIDPGVMIQKFHHDHTIGSIGFSRQENLHVLVSNDSGVVMWDELTRILSQIVIDPVGKSLSLCLSQNVQRIASGFLNGSVMVWDVPSGDNLNVFKGHDNWVRSVAFSDDALRIVSGSDDGTVRIWDVLSGSESKALHGHDDWVYSAAFTSSNAHVVSGSRDSTVRIWDIRTGKELSSWRGRHTGHVYSIAVSSDSKFVISGAYHGSVIIWDMEDPPWYLTDTNWIVSSVTNSRLMWVPPNAQVLQRPNCRILVGESLYSTVNFERSMLAIGPTWERCYTPNTTSAP